MLHSCRIILYFLLIYFQKCTKQIHPEVEILLMLQQLTGDAEAMSESGLLFYFIVASWFPFFFFCLSLVMHHANEMATAPCYLSGAIYICFRPERKWEGGMQRQRKTERRLPRQGVGFVSLCVCLPSAHHEHWLYFDISAGAKKTGSLWNEVCLHLLCQGKISSTFTHLAILHMSCIIFYWFSLVFI